MSTNTIQITLQFKDDGSIAVVDSAKKKIDDLDKSVKGSTGERCRLWCLKSIVLVKPRGFI